jgi:hypothetical protein
MMAGEGEEGERLGGWLEIGYVRRWWWTHGSLPAATRERRRRAALWGCCRRRDEVAVRRSKLTGKMGVVTEQIGVAAIFAGEEEDDGRW